MTLRRVVLRVGGRVRGEGQTLTQGCVRGTQRVHTENPATLGKGDGEGRGKMNGTRQPAPGR